MQVQNSTGGPHHVMRRMPLQQMNHSHQQVQGINHIIFILVN